MDYPALVKRLRANLDKYPGFVNLNAEAATAIETLLAQRAVLVREVEAARAWHDTDARSTGMMMELSTNWDKSRAATDAAFPGGLPK